MHYNNKRLLILRKKSAIYIENKMINVCLVHCLKHGSENTNLSHYLLLASNSFFVSDAASPEFSH